jgi:hypothetical protein
LNRTVITQIANKEHDGNGTDRGASHDPCEPGSVRGSPVDSSGSNWKERRPDWDEPGLAGRSQRISCARPPRAARPLAVRQRNSRRDE